ncbi:hypothetical protein cand_023380 [Cryptosporidium andersoni]|uniref:Uncharacterized protein n=1 Tax=Cryptosporidium andersoni TaxID=117008 RepID=A0A1J4MU79_9CRYT|nr:hypothetical protein cand_023380 [Cryptosporidium andersoni]
MIPYFKYKPNRGCVCLQMAGNHFKEGERLGGVIEAVLESDLQKLRCKKVDIEYMTKAIDIGIEEINAQKLDLKLELKKLSDKIKANNETRKCIEMEDIISIPHFNRYCYCINPCISFPGKEILLNLLNEESFCVSKSNDFILAGINHLNKTHEIMKQKKKSLLENLEKIYILEKKLINSIETRRRLEDKNQVAILQKIQKKFSNFEKGTIKS